MVNGDSFIMTKRQRMRMRTPVSDLVFSIYACVMYGHWGSVLRLIFTSRQSEVAQQNPVQIAVTTAQDPALYGSLKSDGLDPSEGLLKKEKDYLLG
jgi:hypothetical protein